MFKYIGFSLVLILGVACQSEDQSSNATNKTNASDQGKISQVITNQNINDSVFGTMFSTEEQAALLSLKKEFDTAICKGRETTEIYKCYEFHVWKLRSDFLQKNPITLNFPYDGTYQLDSTLVENKLTSIWTNKCGFQKEDKTILHYFCLDANAKIMDYLNTLSKDNEMIQNMTSTYAEKKAFMPNDIEGVIMSSVESLDFKNIDHQIFHMLFHLTIGEEQRATRLIAGAS